jgi:hypothetical protein
VFAKSLEKEIKVFEIPMEMVPALAWDSKNKLEIRNLLIS